MEKTPDEIKKGVERCAGVGQCNECPYSDIWYPMCIIKKSKDAIALIQQLEADNAQLNRCIENMTDKLNATNDEVAKLQAEIEEYEQSAIKCCYESKCNAELNELESLCKRLSDENEQLQSERDAAVKDMESMANYVVDDVCQWCGLAEKECRKGCAFKWRGVQKEDCP